MEIALFAAGCFWGVEETFRTLKGVIKTRVGYCGGSSQNPSYTEVCQGNTGHAEAVEIKFLPIEISYAELLQTFWSCHDPTTLNQQGPDFGTQYRSVIFWTSKEQKKQAQKSKIQLINKGILVVTEIQSQLSFYEAEEYHQQYVAKRRGLLS